MSKEEFELERLKRNQVFYDDQLATPQIKYYLITAIIWMFFIGTGNFFVSELSLDHPIDWTSLPRHYFVHFFGGFIFGILFRWWCKSLGGKNQEKIDELESAL